MQPFPDWIPNIHPIIVHFPIAFLFIAIFVDVCSIILKRQIWIKYSAILLYSIGTMTGLAAYLSGRQAADSVQLPPMANPVLNHHSDLALMTLLFFAFFTLIRVLSVWKGGKRYTWISIILIIISLPGLYLLIETGEHGAELVYKYGVGVQKNAKLIPDKKSTNQNGELGLADDPDGSWRWEPIKGDETVLKNKFVWIEGDADSVGVEFVDNLSGDYSMKLKANIRSMFIVRGENLKSVQADLYVNLSTFKGTIQLVHHVQDGLNYDFIALETNKMILGRLSSGKIKIMDEKAVMFSDWIKLSVVGDGTHFRGYINDKLYTHGHGPESMPGTVGLIINGQGTILLNKIEAKSLR